MNQLEREKQQGKAGNMARQLVQADAVILDELGYLPFPASGGALLYQDSLYVTCAHSRRPMLMTRQG